MLEKSKDFEDIPDLYLIFITRRDFLKNGKGIYIVKRIAQGTNLVLDNGVHEFYVNLEVPAEDEDLRALQEYFKHSERTFENKAFSNLASRVNLLKGNRKGAENMNEFVEKLRTDGRTEEIVALIRKKMQKNWTPARTAELLELDEAYVETIMELIEDDPEATNYDIVIDLAFEEKRKANEKNEETEESK